MNRPAEILAAERELNRAGPVASPASTHRARTHSPARVVTLATLSRWLPDRLIASVLARTLQAETGESVLLVQIDSSEAAVAVRDFAAVQPRLNGEFCFAEFLQETEGGIKKLNLRLTEETQEPGCVKSLLEHFGRH